MLDARTMQRIADGCPRDDGFPGYSGCGDPPPRRWGVRRFSWLPWIVLALLFAFACDLPSTTPPVATRVVIVEGSAGLEATATAMLASGCVLHSMIADPEGPGVWAVFSCVRLPSTRPE